MTNKSAQVTLDKSMVHDEVTHIIFIHIFFLQVSEELRDISVYLLFGLYERLILSPTT